MMNDIESIVLTREEIDGIVKRLGKQISEEYKDKNLLLVTVLKGAVVFLTDLMREITVPCSIDFMSVSSYGSEAKSSGVVKIIKDLDIVLEGYDVLIVEDILDSGRTLNYIKSLLLGRNPKSVRICTLFDKPDGRVSHIDPDYVGALVPNGFIVGYGLDYNEKYRNLPYIGILKKEIYEVKQQEQGK